MGTEQGLPGETVLQPSTIPVCPCCPSRRKAVLRTCMATSAQPLKKNTAKWCGISASTPRPGLVCSLLLFNPTAFMVPQQPVLPAGPAGCVAQGARPKLAALLATLCSTELSQPRICAPLCPCSSPYSVPCQQGRSPDKRQCHKLSVPLCREHSAVAGREVAVRACLPQLLQDPR